MENFLKMNSSYFDLSPPKPNAYYLLFILHKLQHFTRDNKLNTRQAVKLVVEMRSYLHI